MKGEYSFKLFCVNKDFRWHINSINRSLAYRLFTSKLQTFQLSRLRNFQDLQHVRRLAQDRDNWRTIINDIYLVAKAEKSLL